MWGYKDGSRSEAFFQSQECCLGILVPYERRMLTSQVVQWFRQFRELLDKCLVVGRKSTKCTDFRDVGRPRPCGDSGNLVWVALNALTTENVSQKQPFSGRDDI